MIKVKTKLSGRVLGVLLSFALFISMFTFPTVNTEAIDGVGLYNIRIAGVVYENPLAADILDAINVKREAAGLPGLVLNRNMLDSTMVRAAELTVDTSKRDLQNNSYDSMVGAANYCFEMILKTTESDASNIVDKLYDNSDYSKAFARISAMEVGIGVININGDTRTKYICIRVTDNNGGGNSVTSNDIRNLGNVSKSYVMTKAEALKLNEITPVADKNKITDNTITIKKGESKNLLFQIINKEYKNKVYILASYYNSNAKTVALQEKYNTGDIVAKETGTAIITMGISGASTATEYIPSYEQRITVKVPADDGEETMETSFTLSSPSGYIAQPVTGEISVKNGVAPYSYNVNYTVDGKSYNNSYVTFDGSSFTFKPFSRGIHTIVVTATGADGRNAVSEPITYDVEQQMGDLRLNVDKAKVALGNSITLTPAVVGGARPLKYKYAYKNGEPIPGDSATLKLTPTEKGSYTVIATVTDAFNNTKTAEASFEVVDPINVEVTADSYNVMVDEKATLTIKATGIDGIIGYSFECDNEKGVIDRSTVKNNVAAFSSKVAGEYTVTVTARDSYQNYATAQTVIYVGQPISVGLKADPALVEKNQKVTLTADSVGGSGAVTYSYAYEDGTVIPGTGNTTTTSRSNVGTYKVIVTAIDAGKHTAKAEAQFTVKDFAVTLEASKKVINVGDTTVLTATSAGASSSATYSFSGASGLTPNGNKVTFKPTSAGSYTVTVKVTDGEKTASAEMTVKVNPKLTVSILCDSGTEVDYNSDNPKTVLFTAKAQGGAEDKTYKFSYYGREEDRGILNSISIKASEPGTLTVGVTVTDENGYTATARTSINVVQTLDYLSLTYNGSTKLSVGESVEFTAGSKGGHLPVTYTFYYAMSDNGTYTDCSKNSQFKINGNKMTFTPTAAGIYKFSVKVTDRVGIVREIADSSRPQITVTGVQSNMTATVTTPKTDVLEGNVVFTANVSNGTAPYKYYYIYDGGPEKYSTSKSYTVSVSEGTHNMAVRVEDSTGASVTSAPITVNVMPQISVTLKSSNDKAVVGDEITLIANATGGFGTLSYTFTAPSEITLTKNGNTASFTPTSAGSYTISLKVSDTKGYSKTVSVMVNVNDKLSVKLTPSTTKTSVGFKVKLTATASGGYENYTYSYSYKGDAKGGLTISGTNETPIVAVNKTGIYTVTVSVKDSIGHTATDSVTLEIWPNFEDRTVVTVDGKEVDSSADVSVGQKIEINGGASGGSGDYTYFFYFKDVNSSSWFDIYSPPTVKDTAIQFDVEGTYKIKVVVKDSNGCTRTKIYTVTVK